MEDDTKRQEPRSRRIFTLKGWTREHDWPSLPGLKHLVFHAQANGFHKVIKRCGRRVLIEEEAFFQWLDEQNSNDDSKH